MFVQVFQGAVADAAEARRTLDRWYDELSPGAKGWLGSTAGVTDDGRFVALVRFESEEAARRNSDRPEQGQWWGDAEKAFTGPVTFHDCREVEVGRGGGSDEAGFVQVIQGRVTDVNRMRELDRQWEQFPDQRPDLLGTVTALHGDGGFTTAAYFTSEAEAREGERSEPPPEVKALVEEEMALLQDVRFYDLRDPWLLAPREAPSPGWRGR